MIREEKHLKDSSPDLEVSVTDTSTPISYRKTEKLITALYMVTDIIDKEEPLRNKLRTLGIGIISDINSIPAHPGNRFQAVRKVAEVMSFLDIASSMNIISQMNGGILRKEFLELDQSIKESVERDSAVDRNIDLNEFFAEEGEEIHPSLIPNHHRLSNDGSSMGHGNRIGSLGHGTARLGVQKGGTLLKAIKDISHHVPASNGSKGHGLNGAGVTHEHFTPEQFDALKKQRRQDIINIIKIIGGSATIKDIKDKAQSLPQGAASLQHCGEKTLQRELASMVGEGVLDKTGSKRWSKYIIK